MRLLLTIFQKIEKGQVLNINFEEDDISKHNKNCVDPCDKVDKESKSYILLKLNIQKEHLNLNNNLFEKI